MPAAPAASASDLLDAWEEGQGQHPLHRALTLLRLAEPDSSIAALAELPVGERDRRLLDARALLFGSKLDATAICPACKEPIEATLTAGDLVQPAAAAAVGELQLAGRKLPIRLPTTLDLLEAAEAPEAERRTLLLERCTGERLTGREADAAEAHMTELDPLAEIELHFDCPACGHGWEELFDIASWLWAELGDQALRLLREVDLLARIYGWSEAEILSLPPRRRSLYLQLAAGD
jgi:hypothetical protein